MNSILIFILMLVILLCEYYIILKGKNSSIYLFGLFVLVNLLVFFIHRKRKEGQALCNTNSLVILGCVGLFLFMYTQTKKQKYEMIIKMIALFMFIYS